MEDAQLEALKYPVGKYQYPAHADGQQIKYWIKTLESFPSGLAELATPLTDADLEKTYRPGSWTVRQVIHHLADSHANAYIRLKLALTEENPTIRPYFEAQWAETTDAQHGDIQSSLTMLTGIHERLVACLKSLSLEDLNRTYFHPEHQRTFTLTYMLGMYAWHCEHHYMHIVNATSN